VPLPARINSFHLDRECRNHSAAESISNASACLTRGIDLERGARIKGTVRSMSVTRCNSTHGAVRCAVAPPTSQCPYTLCNQHGVRNSHEKCKSSVSTFTTVRSLAGLLNPEDAEFKLRTRTELKYNLPFHDLKPQLLPATLFAATSICPASIAC
jgi:hypothetical protein